MGKVLVVFDTNDPKSKSRTQQHFAKEADINNIMRRYQKTGILGNPADGLRKGFFGDFTMVSDFQTMVNQIQEAQLRFMALPALVRERFANDPAQLMAFIADPKNIEEGRKLGLIKPMSKEEQEALALASKAKADAAIAAAGPAK